MLKDTTQRDPIALDIETTGFSFEDEITVAGLWFTNPEPFAEIVVNTEGAEIGSSAISSRIDHELGIDVRLHSVTNEADLLSCIAYILYDVSRSDNLLVAFNGECWKGGFDLPFLRSRCIQYNEPWVLDGFWYADLWEPVKKRLNTTVKDDAGRKEINDLCGGHDLLFGKSKRTESKREGGHLWYSSNPYDPFSDSSEAVKCFRDNNYEPLIRHNLADIHRTAELAELLFEFVSGKDLKQKRL